MEENIWYTAKPIQKNVSKDEFVQFIKSYPRKLERDVWGACDPPGISYNDFELAERWPYSIVASTHVYSDDPEDYWYEPVEERRYIIVVNHEELYASRTGRTLASERG